MLMASGETDPAKTAFIRNIVFELTEEHILKAFEKYGKVTQAHIARDPRGLSKGYVINHCFLRLFALPSAVHFRDTQLVVIADALSA